MGAANAGARGGAYTLEDDPKILSALNGEKVLWSGRVTQLAGIRSRKETKIRVLMISDSAVYKVRHENTGGGKIKRRIDYRDFCKISYNLRNNNFIMHSSKFDYRFSSVDCEEIVKCIASAKKAWERKNNIEPSTEPFLVKSSGREPINPPPPVQPTSGSHLSSAGLSLRTISTGTTNDQLTVSLREQSSNFRLCFCMAGYRMCTHVHPHFERMKTNPGAPGTCMSCEPGREGKEGKGTASEFSPPPPPPTAPMQGAGVGRRRRKVNAAAMEASNKLREKKAENQAESDKRSEELNEKALEDLLGLMAEIRSKGVVYLRSKFVRDPDKYLENQGPLNHNREMRKAISEQKKQNTPNVNPAIDQFLRSAKDPQLIQLAGLQLLESVYSLPHFHLQYLKAPLDAMKDLPLSKSKTCFRNMARQVEERKYDLLWRIGQGAFGSVFAARPLPGKFKKLKNMDQKTRIAVKIVDLAGEDDLAEINKEIEALAEGEICPQLVCYYGCETVDSYLMLSMELMDGSLDQLKPLSEEAVAVIMREALLGLLFLWNKYKKFHRDLKAANILYSLDGSVKLADFGCVRSLGEESKHAKTYVGSPYWMAPEVIKGDPYDQLADVWSLGVTSIEIVTGRVPFYNKSPQVAMQSVTQSAEPRLSGEYSPELRKFVESCLMKDPDERKPIDQLLDLPFIKGAGNLKGWLPGKAFHMKAMRNSKERSLLKRPGGFNDQDE